MRIRFRRSISLLPGIRLNLGARGTSVSIGRRGARLTIGPRGTHATVGLPGTGLSIQSRLDEPPTQGQARELRSPLRARAAIWPWLLLGVIVLALAVML